MRSRFYVLLIMCPSFLFAGEYCELQPEGFDESRRSILDFEENIENHVSDIYRAQYPVVEEKLKALRQLQNNLTKIENRYSRKYIRSGHRHPKNRAVDRSRRRKRKELFLQLAEQEIHSEEELDHYLKEVKVIRPMSFDVYQEYSNKVNNLKEQTEELNTSLLEIQSFGFLQFPDIGFSIRGSRSYGHLKLEGLFRVPKDDLLKLPFLKIGFETSPNTIIYSCVHLDEFRPDKNRIYIYFLNTTKLYTIHWKDFIMRPNLAIRHLLTFRKEPQGVISPLPFILNPLAEASETLDNLGQFQQLSNHASFNQIMNTAGRFNFLDFSANLNPIFLAIKNNVQVGVQGFVIHSDKLQIRYAGTTLYGLINFNLAVQNQNADFSPFMNIMTLDDISH